MMQKRFVLNMNVIVKKDCIPMYRAIIFHRMTLQKHRKMYGVLMHIYCTQIGSIILFIRQHPMILTHRIRLFFQNRNTKNEIKIRKIILIAFCAFMLKEKDGLQRICNPSFVVAFRLNKTPGSTRGK